MFTSSGEEPLQSQTIKLKFILNRTVCYKNNVSVTVVLVMPTRMKDNAKIHYRKDLRGKKTKL